MNATHSSMCSVSNRSKLSEPPGKCCTDARRSSESVRWCAFRDYGESEAVELLSCEESLDAEVTSEACGGTALRNADPVACPLQCSSTAGVSAP